MMDFLSLLLPISYLALLLGSLTVFSYLYRRRQATRALSLEPWFPTHIQRNVYLSLLELQSQPDKKIPDTILRAALLRRAVEDVHRLLQIRSQKPALMQLLQRGSVGDDLFKRFQAAEKEMEIEIKDVVNEANALAPLPAGGNPQTAWGNVIFQSASEMAHREQVVKKLREKEDGRQEARAEWEGRRKGISEKFMGELEAPDLEQREESKVKVDKAAPTKNASSDEDTVLVEAGSPDATMAGPEDPGSEGAASLGVGGGGSAKKKKKGKK